MKYLDIGTVVAFLAFVGLSPRCWSNASPFPIRSSSFVALPTDESVLEDSDELNPLGNDPSHDDLPPFVAEARQKRAVDATATRESEIWSFRVQSDIRYRYSHTGIRVSVVNPNPWGTQEVNLTVALSELAFVSSFVIDFDGQLYKANVEERDVAGQIYSKAKDDGISAALVALNPEDVNQLIVSVNIRPSSRITFLLSYEELLTRDEGKYTQCIAVDPEQIKQVHDFRITFNIDESQPLTLLQATEPSTSQVGFGAAVEKIGNRGTVAWSNAAVVRESDGRFTVEYAIQSERGVGEVLVRDGYFVHFFEPEGIQPLKKHVTFVIDTSGSMSGRRLLQVKEAMHVIIDELKPEDFFSIITFAGDVKTWNRDCSAGRWSLFPATGGNIAAARGHIQSLVANGWTNIHDALITALTLTSASKQMLSGNCKDTVVSLPADVEPIIVFLTDGDPTNGITDKSEIKTRIRNANPDARVPIFSVALCNDVDFQFLQSLSVENKGVARKIYEDADTRLQLTDFYTDICSPSLSSVNFKYTSAGATISNLTSSVFAGVGQGKTVAVAGMISTSDDIKRNNTVGGSSPDQKKAATFAVAVDAVAQSGAVRKKHTDLTVDFSPAATPADAKLESLWAYLTIWDLIDKDLSSKSGEGLLPHETPRQSALRLAMKFGFVTPLTSLVVTAPILKSLNTKFSMPDASTQSVKKSQAEEEKRNREQKLHRRGSLGQEWGTPVHKLSIGVPGFDPHSASGIAGQTVNFGLPGKSSIGSVPGSAQYPSGPLLPPPSTKKKSNAGPPGVVYLMAALPTPPPSPSRAPVPESNGFPFTRAVSNSHKVAVSIKFGKVQPSSNSDSAKIPADREIGTDPITTTAAPPPQRRKNPLSAGRGRSQRQQLPSWYLT